MATAISDTLIQIDDSIARGLPIHELVINNWGFQNDDIDPVYPNYDLRGLPAVAGMAIGPRSHVDRVWVVPDLLVTATVPSAFGPVAPYAFPRLCSVGNPIYFPIQGKRDVGAPPLITSLRLLAHRPFPPYALTTPGLGYDSDTTLMPAEYIKASASAAIPFPLYTTIDAGGSLGTPMLQLYLFLVPPTLSIPNKRGPYVAADAVAVPDAGTDETYITAIPAFGRNSGYLQFYCTGSLNASFRVGGILNGDDGNPSEVIPREETIATAAGVTATARWRGALQIGGWDYLIVYCTRISGTGQAWVRWMLNDDCCASGDIITPPS